MGNRGRFAIVLSGMFLICAVIGCDDRPAIPAELQQQQSTQAPEDPSLRRPTTQELVSGSYTPLLLDTLPLVIQAPVGWKVIHLGSIVMVEGFTPVDQARIQLSRRDLHTQDQIDLLYAGAKKEVDANPQSRMTVELRDIGPLKILERRSVGRTLSIPILDAQGIQKLDEAGQPMVQRSTKMNWKLNVFVPTPDGFEQYELNFIDLSVEQYEKEREFLEKIVYSIAPVGAAPNAATTAPGK